ncbi:PHP domain-like protein [Auriscalpium vulgare]|uniref:PHP domain-like protein n=1 Tax=Auriscalpium vulgare TaxID=40419 RepID=A0ACB8S5V3_9AGAM|nr:PHP domain-like protein [Auriscalpium vulgare]
MYFDLNVPAPSPASSSGSSQVQSKKGKNKQPLGSQQSIATSPSLFSPAQINAVEARIDLLVHLGYSVIAFNQTVSKKVEQRTFINTLDALLSQLRKRPGIVYLKRLTIVLDEDSEKGFGLTNANAPLLAPYDILALTATTEATFSVACLTHTLPSQLTTHIISIPLTLPRLPFRLKHTLVRSALRNGAVFEIAYAGALGAGDGDGGGGSGASTKRNWWAAAREVVRVTKGKGIILSSGTAEHSELRSPKDIGNLITFLELAQNLAHDTSTTTPKSLVLRAQTRKTYRAIFSEPKVVLPHASTQSSAAAHQDVEPEQATAPESSRPSEEQVVSTTPSSSAVPKKRPREESTNEPQTASGDGVTENANDGGRKKKKGKKSGGAHP